MHALNRMRYRVPLLSSKAERCYEVDIKGCELQAGWPRFPHKFGASRSPRADGEKTIAPRSYQLLFLVGPNVGDHEHLEATSG